MEERYLNVDFITPMLGFGVAAVLLIGGVPLLLHGWYRRKRFEQLADGYQTYKLRSSIRAELVAGGLVLSLMAALGIFAVLGYTSSARNLQSNIEQLYNPAKLELGTFNGSWMSADITLDDGTSFSNARVDVRAGNEPFIEDLWYHYHPKPRG